MIRFLKGMARKKEIVLKKMQNMTFKTLSKSEDEIHSKTQMICFEEDMKRILFKNNQIQIKIIYSTANEIVDYKIMIKSFELGKFYNWVTIKAIKARACIIDFRIISPIGIYRT